MHASKRKRAALTGTKDKVAVIGAISRKGMVVTKVIENTDTETLDGFRPSGSWAKRHASFDR